MPVTNLCDRVDVVDGVRHARGLVAEERQPCEQADPTSDDLWPGFAQLELVGLHQLSGASLRR